MSELNDYLANSSDFKAISVISLIAVLFIVLNFVLLKVMLLPIKMIISHMF